MGPPEEATSQPHGVDPAEGTCRGIRSCVRRHTSCFVRIFDWSTRGTLLGRLRGQAACEIVECEQGVGLRAWAEIGECHRPETHLIPVVLEAIDGQRPELVIHGEDYATPDGTCIRDYVHVLDLVEAHVLGRNWLAAGKGSRVFNLGTGTGFSVREVIAAAEAITGCKVPHRIGPRRAGDATRLVSGSRRAAQELGWPPPATRHWRR
jgi:hypothetical protein